MRMPRLIVNPSIAFTRLVDHSFRGVHASVEQVQRLALCRQPTIG